MASNYDYTKAKEKWASAVPKQSYKMPKTRVKISFPAQEDAVKLMKMAEITAPGGVNITFTLPFPMSEAGMGKIAEAIRNCGGTCELET